MHLRLLISLLLLVLASACAAPASKGTFEVQVTNLGNTPISAGLTKQGRVGVRPPLEEGWASPEDIALGAPELGGKHWGQLIQPGQTKVFGPIEGTFPGGIYAILRVYLGDHTVDELLAYSRSDPDRVDVMIPNGPSSYVVTNPGGKLTVEAK